MSTRVYWTPLPDLTASRYEIYVVGATEQLLAAIPHTIPGPYWLAPTRRFTYEDPSGTDATIYRVRALGSSGELYGDTGPFQPSASVAAGLVSRRQVDHDYGGANALAYQTASGVGVPDATIRVFRAVDWDALRRAAPLAITSTDALGKWVSSVWLEPGFEYVVSIEKPGSYGPDTARITV